MTTPWLTLVGIGDDGSLPAAGRTALEAAEVVYGGARHLDLAGDLKAETRVWPSPFSKVYEDLRILNGRKTVILASGDPQWFGIGSSLTQRFSREELTVLPSPSAFQLAAARMGWAVQNTDCLSVHGRPLETLRAALYPGARILVLTSNASAPKLISGLLAEEGYGPSIMTILEHLGGPNERRVESTAEAFSADIADLHTLAIEARLAPGTTVRSRVPGLPDDAFVHDGKMTKREIRAVTLAALQPHPGAVLWDIGAGCGSIGIEWLRAADRTSAIGLEPHKDRRAMAQQNALALGVPHFKVVDASAPDGLSGLETPDAIFIGGGLTAEGVVPLCHAALEPGGRLVANAVTLESEQVLLAAWQEFGGELTRHAIQRASPVGGLTGWRPLMPVTQWSLIKT
ncbi:precorrin-6Y C5,15-methyltransferase (decarboxylating) [Roseibium hamelinense]|uniref:Precorrin-6Y C5,15-methyltransferase (Decarboxylating) n=1 Tax=Roseibium hamelinense TaxID=150831 RepID=A0A562T1X9_9HYPH|nr:precorrin-6y C5,15-methyltransferase (decarboxylating) subunit CbiE [Roseibium hamelinense]MTI43851.1 precorrin-6y C5,15-methyltransferase (decarboxylating) subunit CbiE [Roseibium hamelinense]TWI87064.1 precorrin-6Y C5,15-methyltransferase (decarboxylating) [Roseibium hamelinense]